MELLAVLAAGVGSGLLPVALAEVTAVAAGALTSPTDRFVYLATFTVGHVGGKCLWYWIGTQEARVTWPWLRARLDQARTLAQAHPVAGLTVMFSSATISIPPFHLAATAAGVVHAPFLPFVGVALVGRLIRFGVLATAPGLVRSFWG